MPDNPNDAGPGKAHGPDFEFRWTNFRSIADSGWVSVRPITIFIGPNSSGKSSLFAPLLLLKQTIESGDPTLPLKTTGPLANVGSFRDLVFRHRNHSVVTFDLRFKIFSMDAPRLRMKSGLAHVGRITLEFGSGGRDSDVILQSSSLRDINGRIIVERRRLANGTYSVDSAEKIPAAFREAVIAAKPEHFFFPTTRLLYKLLDDDEREGRRARKSIMRLKSLPNYFPMVGTAQSGVSHFFSHISYVGPLRKQPKRFYELSGEVPDSVGPQGEHAPEILFKRRDRNFVKAINEWVARFDLANVVQCDLLSPGIFAVRLVGKGVGSAVDFADTGFGLSQILPLIVQGFHGGRADTMIVEQPEIHLNPKLQCALADFFVTLVSLEKAVIVETHSEHVIMRIRSLIAAGSIKAEDVALYFVERDGDKTLARRIPIHADGHIEPQQWPRGFFEESLREALNLVRISTTTTGGSR
jgi:AAA domain, putative AbiEii toxin, Type IV TA system/Protein of unknown function (DUF3696)